MQLCSGIQVKMMSKKELAEARSGLKDDEPAPSRRRSRRARAATAARYKKWCKEELCCKPSNEVLRRQKKAAQKKHKTRLKAALRHVRR